MSQPNWIKWIIYFLIVYILFLIKEAFAIVLFFFVLFYTISFSPTMLSNFGPFPEKKYFSILICTLISCQENFLWKSISASRINSK